MKTISLTVSFLGLTLVAACATGGGAHSHAAGVAHADHQQSSAAEVKTVNNDTDGDGVPNWEDNCPNEAGEKENYGCATAQLVRLTKSKIDILSKIYFATGSADIEERSHPLLENLGRVMLSHPEIVMVRVEGHTDNTGDAAFNMDLSQRRAAAVVAYLVDKGVDASRMNAKGFGPEQPVADNDTDEGRAANRRVEFVIISE